MRNNEETTVKEAAIQFDTFIRDGGVGSSMFFVLILLIIVNTHSLHFLFGDGVLNWVFSVFGAIGFSIATTSVIRKPVAAWMKYLFPLFDTLLVFLGFNLLNDSIPVHFIMTVLFSLFSGAILVGLGTINFRENEREAETCNYETEIKLLEAKIKLHIDTYREMNTKLSNLKSENETLKVTNKKNSDLYSNYLEQIEKNELLESELEKVKYDFDKYKSNTSTSLSDLESSKSYITELRSNLVKKTKLLEDTREIIKEIDSYKMGYLKYHAGNIRKKKPENWTEEETQIINELEGFTNV